MLQSSRLSAAERYLSWFSLFDSTTLENMLAPRLRELTRPEQPNHPLNLFRSLYAARQSASRLQRLQVVDIYTMLANNLLLKADKIGMHFSLEMRTPFLNRSIASLLYNLPDNWKIARGQQKLCQRKLLAATFPTEFTQQAKHGFEVPIGQWLRNGGLPQLEQKILHDSRLGKILQREVVTQLWHQHQRGEREHGLALFALAVLAIWCETFNVEVD
jgi:asparagine synthase (glutamine-hydrolysing)